MAISIILYPSTPCHQHLTTYLPLAVQTKPLPPIPTSEQSTSLRTPSTSFAPNIHTKKIRSPLHSRQLLVLTKSLYLISNSRFRWHRRSSWYRLSSWNLWVDQTSTLCACGDLNLFNQQVYHCVFDLLRSYSHQSVQLSRTVGWDRPRIAFSSIKLPTDLLGRGRWD